MPPSVDSPVQTGIAITVPDGIGKNGSLARALRSSSRRRIFVQTDTGSLLGIELNRADNAKTVKKKMQTLLNVPTDQTALVFGDTIYKGDLSKVRNDSPLLLTRELQRSLSTPCIYLSPDVQESLDGGQPLELVGGLSCCIKMKSIMKEINKAISCGIEPVPVSGGLGGAYYFRSVKGDSIAVLKPTDEEPFAPNNPKGYVGRTLGQPGLKKAVRVGETGVREVAAYLLDHDNFAKVPPTVLVKAAHHAFHVNGASPPCKGCETAFQPVAKLASCQQFVHHDCDASDHGTSRFSVAAVHRIGILDIRIFNTDRHGGNILIRKVNPFDPSSISSTAHVSESLELIPIDHGLCLPEGLEDPYFEWLHWRQASVPFSEEELDYIKRLDGYKDAEELRRELPMLREACLRMLILSTTLLKRAAAAGFCLAEIGEVMSRDGIEEASELEQICIQAKLEVEREFLSEQLCRNDDHNDTAVCGISVGEDFQEQFEFEMDQDFDTKSNFLSCQTETLPRKAEYVNLDLEQCSFPLFPTSLGYVHGFRSSPNDVLSLHAFLETGLGAPTGKKSDDISCTSTVEAAGFDLQLGRLGHVQDFPFSKTLRSNCIEHSAKVCSECCPLMEEEEVSFTDNSTNLDDSLLETHCVSPRAMSLRSVSFHNRKQGYWDCCERKMPASETTGKAQSYGGYPPFLPGELTEEEWSSFMNHFQRLLEGVVAGKHGRSVCHRPRLGISCQF